jgi:hypothetical protein
VVTFLFTDVEGSTRRWETDAQGMRAALAAHDKVLRTAIEAYDGFVFSHSGDGCVAAFASPMSAVNAAIDAQRELQLPVRMGLATGEAELRDGDYFGTVLNRAARVMAAGHGGQILLAESTAGLLSGVDLLDLGPRRLRDLPTPVQVFQVQADGPHFRRFPSRDRPDSWSVPGRCANDTKWRSLVADGLSRGDIEACRYVVKVGREEPCIVIERRRSRLVAKQACDGNHRSSRLYGQRRCGVAQVVRSDGQAQCSRSRIEAVAPKITVSHRRGVRGGEHEFGRGRLRLQRGQFVNDSSRDRNGA